jgi:diaminopimelate decarboxylase
MNTHLFLNSQFASNIRELSGTINAVFYLYNKERIRQNCQLFTNIPYGHKAVHFAMMANSTPEFLKLVKQNGLCIFVNSLLHLELALEIGYRGDEIVFAASAMDDDLMNAVKESGAIIILDSIGQLERWRKLYPKSGVGIRCNIGDLVSPKETIAGYFIGKESRLGLTIPEINMLKGNKNIEGLHIYVGTNIADVEYFIYCYEQIIRLVELFPNIKYLDFGGGFGLPEESSTEFDITAYGLKVAGLMEQLSERLVIKVKLLLEPGRIIGGDAGYFVCKVVDIKIRDDHQYIGVNASSVQFPRPLFYPEKSYHPISILHENGNQNNQSNILSTIYGCSTYSRDFLARNIHLPVSNVDDIVVLGYAGSYCSSAYTNFLGFPPAKEVFI